MRKNFRLNAPWLEDNACERELKRLETEVENAANMVIFKWHEAWGTELDDLTRGKHDRVPGKRELFQQSR